MQSNFTVQCDFVIWGQWHHNRLLKRRHNQQRSIELLPNLILL